MAQLMAQHEAVLGIVDAVTAAARRPERTAGDATAARPLAPVESVRPRPHGAAAAAGPSKGGGFRHAQTLNGLVGPAAIEELRAMRRREEEIVAELEALRREKGQLERVLDLLGIGHGEAR